MPKIRVVKRIAVYAHGQSIRTTPLCYIDSDDAKWWVDSGGAIPRNHWNCIILNKIKSTQLLGQSGRMGASAMEGVAQGGRFYLEILKRWRFGFVEPAHYEPRPGGVLHYDAPAMAESV